MKFQEQDVTRLKGFSMMFYDESYSVILNMHSTPQAWKYDFKDFKYEACLWKEATKPKNVKVKRMGYLAKDVNVQVKLMKGFMWDKDHSSTMKQMLMSYS